MFTLVTYVVTLDTIALIIKFTTLLKHEEFFIGAWSKRKLGAKSYIVKKIVIP